MADALVDIILHGREERNIEYKESVPWGDADIKAKLTRAALAMSNIRDGGYIVIGVEQAGDAFTPTGITAVQISGLTARWKARGARPTRG